jgi:hypothetical protein
MLHLPRLHPASPRGHVRGDGITVGRLGWERPDAGVAKALLKAGNTQ